MELTASQKNQILKCAIELDINPRQLEFRKIARPDKLETYYEFFGTKITFLNSEYYFSFSSRLYYTLNITVNYSPSKNLKHYQIVLNYNGLKDYDWGFIYSQIKEWLISLKEELQAIEEIEGILAMPYFFLNESNEKDSNEKFSKEEQETITGKINELKNKVANDFDLLKKDIEHINSKLDELISSVKNANKFDFKTVFFGLTLNIASSYMYSHSSQWWDAIKDLFNGIKFLK